MEIVSILIGIVGILVTAAYAKHQIEASRKSLDQVVCLLREEVGAIKKSTEELKLQTRIVVTALGNAGIADLARNPKTGEVTGVNATAIMDWSGALSHPNRLIRMEALLRSCVEQLKEIRPSG